MYNIMGGLIKFTGSHQMTLKCSARSVEFTRNTYPNGTAINICIAEENFINDARIHNTIIIHCQEKLFLREACNPRVGPEDIKRAYINEAE